MSGQTIQSALDYVAARERRFNDLTTRDDAIRSDLLRNKEPNRIAAERGVPLYLVLRIQGSLR